MNLTTGQQQIEKLRLKTFNGHPEMLDNTVGVMYDLKLTAQKLCATPFPGKAGYTIGPSFEFIVPAGS